MKKLLTLCILVFTSTFFLFRCTQNNNESNEKTNTPNEIFAIPENSNRYKDNSNVKWGFIDKEGSLLLSLNLKLKLYFYIGKWSCVHNSTYLYSIFRSIRKSFNSSLFSFNS